jgi:hypothetical protein
MATEITVIEKNSAESAVWQHMEKYSIYFDVKFLFGCQSSVIVLLCAIVGQT